MDQTFIIIVKGILLTEALTHAVRSWGIFDDVRSYIVGKSDFSRRLLACFECTSVWIASCVFIYLTFLEFWPFTCIIILSRLATIAHIVVDLVDSLRAAIANRV